MRRLLPSSGAVMLTAVTFASVYCSNNSLAHTGGEGGGTANHATGNNAVVAGGIENSATGDQSAVGGGRGNTVSNVGSTVGGGRFNSASGFQSTVSGGHRNTAAGGNATVGGGDANAARGSMAAVGGGNMNSASAEFATVPGGSRGKALHAGAFVWSGVDSVDTSSTNARSFTVRASGGVRFITVAGTSLKGAKLLSNATAWTALSDRESKTDFQPIKPREVLSKLAAMPVTSWQYKHDPSRRYIGPTSQDFMAAFHLGQDDKGINTLDADGVTFAAIKGLVEELKERDKEIAELKTKSAEVEHLKRKLEIMEERLDSLPPAP